MRDKKLGADALEIANYERAKLEWSLYFYSVARDGVIEVLNADTGTICACDKTGGTCESARFFNPHCKHFFAVRIRHQSRKAGAR